MAKIADEITKLQNDSIDIDLQSRLNSVKKNMRGLDSSTDKYNKLVKEVLELQIKRLENEKKKLKNADVPGKVAVQTNITKLERELNRQVVSFTKYKLDTKANASLKNKSSISLSDLENVFHEFIDDLSTSVAEASKASINLSKKTIYRKAINSKRDKQEAYHQGTTNSSVSDTRKGIAGAEVTKLLESEKKLTDSLRDAFVDIKETVESTSSKREFDIQYEKFKLLIEVLEKNRGVIADNFEKELDNLIQAVKGEVKTKSGRLSTLGGKYEDIKADAERLGITEKINAAGNTLARGLGKLDGELGNFAEGILAGIEGVNNFATQLFKLPETFSNFKKFLGGTISLLRGNSAGDMQTKKLEEVKQSIDELAEGFSDVINEKTDIKERDAQVKNFGKGLKNTTKLTKVQNENLVKGNKLTKLTHGLMTALNVELSLTSKRFGLTRIRSFFTNFGMVLARFAGIISGAALTVWTVGKALGAKAFIRGLKFFKLGIFAIGNVFKSLLKFVLPLLMTGITALITGFTALSLPVQALVAGIGLAVGAFFLFPKMVAKVGNKIGNAVDKFVKWIGRSIDYIKNLIPDWDDLNPFDAKFKSGVDRVGGWLNSINPFGRSESEKQAQMMTERIQAQSSSPSGTVQPSTPYGGLGSMTAQSESGKAGSAAIGWDSVGGWSYGKYQVKQSNMPSFMKTLDEDTRNQLQAAGPVGSKEFNKKWKELASKGAIGTAEQKYIEDTHYKPTLAKSNDGQELSKRGKGLQELLFSISTNEGEDLGSDTINSALKNKDVSKMSDADIIEAISAYRKGNLKNRYRSSTPAVQASIARRIEEERIGALGMDNQKMQLAMNKKQDLEFDAQSLMSIKQASVMAKAIPPASINQSNIQNGASSTPNTPVELRNTCSTFIRGMDCDFGSYI